MRKVLLLLIVVLSAITSFAQISVTATAGTTGPTAYTTLSAAFTAINAGTHQGTITISVTANSTETAACVLNSSGAGSASYTSVLIQPTVDGVSISGPTVTGRGLIELNGADNVTIDGDNPNTAGTNRNLTITNTAATTVTYTSAIRIAVSTLITTADNNTIKNCIINGNAGGLITSSNTSITTGAVGSSHGVLVSGGASTSSATTAPSAISSNTTVMGTTTTALNLTIDNNQVTACGKAVHVTGNAITCIPVLTITNNVIGNSTAGASTGVSWMGICAQGYSTGSKIASNTIYVESWVTTTSAPNGPAGIVLGYASTTGNGLTIEKNSINRIFSNSGSGYAATGINMIGATSPANITIQNNFITNVNSNYNNSATGTTYGSKGIKIAGLNTVKVYHNSINLFGAGIGTGGAADLSACVCITSSSAVVDIRNNILANTKTGFTGSYDCCIFYTTGMLSSTINNNYYFSAAGATNYIGASASATYTAANFVGGVATPSTNLRALTSTFGNTSNDNASIASTSAAPFVSSTDLHISIGVTPTQLESGGASVGLTTDFDGQARPGPAGSVNGGATASDIGADEFDGVPLDLTAPSILYTSLPNTVSLSNVTTTSFATITDVSGVNTTAGTKPRLYYKKSTETNDLSGWKYVESSSSSSPFDFTIDYSVLTGGSVSPGDVIQYFVVAQDLAPTPNVAINSGAFAATPASVALTSAAFPIGGTIKSYTIATVYSGTINVGSSETITSITNAGGLFDVLNNNVVGGNLTVNITSNLASETGAVALNQISEQGVGGYTVTIKPSAVYAITGTSAAGLITLNGADRITIDGSTSGGTDQSLTITNTNTGTGSAVVWVQTTSGGNAATSNTIKNCVIIGSGKTQTFCGIGLGGSGAISASSLGLLNNNNTVTNNSISKAKYGIFTQGTTGTSKNTGTVISKNTLTTASPDNIGDAGILASNEDGILISENTIANLQAGSTTDVFGITLGAIGVTTSTYTGSQVINATITKNVIGTLAPASTYSTIGIFVAPQTEGVTTISNNSIYGANNNGTSGDFSAGVFVGGGAGSTTRIYNNSVSESGTFTGGAYPSYALAVGGTDPVIDIRNNIFTSTGSTGANLNRAVGFAYSTFVNLTSDNNLFYVSGTSSLLVQTATLANTGGTNYSTLSAWRTASSKDALSINADPGYTSLSNLLPTSGNDLIGTNLASVTTDITGASRLNPPAMGAYEVSLPGIWSSTAATNVWETAGNWRDGAVPTTGITVYVPSTSTNMPTLATSPTLKRLLNNGTLTISGANTISASGDVYNNGLITGSTAGLTLNGATAQTVTLTGTSGSINVQDLTLNNSSGATVSLGTGIGKLNVTGTVNLTAGTLTTGGRLVLKSSAVGTARIPAITGAISGTVTTETYIPGGRRAFRFLGHPFSTALNMGSLVDNVFITGAGAGFDATATNNPSSYWFDNTATAPGAWTAFTSTTDNSWTQYRGMRLLVRGDRTQATTLTGGNPTPLAVTLDVTGTLNTGAANISVPTGGSYHLVSNPYPSPTDIGTVVDATASIGTQYWVWDANASTKGAYITKTVGGGAYNLAMNSAFIVQPTSGTTLAFAESNKVATATNALFRNAAPKGIMELQLLYNNYPADNLFIKLNEKSAVGFENTDGAKLAQSDMNFYALSSDSKKLSLDARPLDKDDVIKLGLATNVNTSYKIKVAGFGFTNDVEMFLKDRFTNTLTPVTTGMEYEFAVTSNAASQGENRFELVMKQLPLLATFTTEMEVSVTPNPVQDQMLISYSSPEKGDVSIRLFSNEGKAIKTESLGLQQSGRVSWNIKNLAAGTYTVELSVGKQRITKQIVKL